MYIISNGRKSEYIPITARDFSTNGNDNHSLVVTNPEIFTAAIDLGFRWRWPLQLATWIPDSKTPFFLYARDGKSGFLDSLLKRPLFDVIPVHLIKREYELLYAILYPHRAADPQMIADAMERDAEYCKARGLFFT